MGAYCAEQSGIKEVKRIFDLNSVKFLLVGVFWCGEGWTLREE